MGAAARSRVLWLPAGNSLHSAGSPHLATGERAAGAATGQAQTIKSLIVGTRGARRQVESCEKSLAGRNRDRFTETHEFRPGPHLAEIVVAPALSRGQLSWMVG